MAAEVYGRIRPSGWRMAVALWRLGRYRFLGGGFVLYALGAALARMQRPIDIGAYVLGQSFITATQLMTHYSNDYFDLESDRANATPTTWSGGSGVLLEGIVPPRLARNVAVGFGGIALFLAALISATCRVSSGMGVVFALALVLSWEYSGPPLRLHAHGLGPATAALVVGGLTPLAGYGMQGCPWSSGVLLSVLPVVIAQFALILVLDFPDAEGDARSGKHTLVVLLGPARVVGIAACGVTLVYAILPLLIAESVGRRLVLGIAATFPVGAWLVWTLLRGAWRGGGAKGPLTWSGVLWFAAVSVAALVGTALDVAGGVGRG
jgi:1,4-dihydroxy-2-naphthoate octaprenyltransferase